MRPPLSCRRGAVPCASQVGEPEVSRTSCYMIWVHDEWESIALMFEVGGRVTVRDTVTLEPPSNQFCASMMTTGDHIRSPTGQTP